MKDITKQLTITRLAIHHRMEGKYQIELMEPRTWHEARSTVTLTAEDMIRFGLDPGEDLLGATLEVRLKAIPYVRETRSPDTVLITRLVRSSEVQQHYGMIPPSKAERRTCRLEAKTPVPAGTLVIMPSTYNELNLLLTEGEYRRLQGLPAGTALELRLRQAGRHFRDVVLKYRGTLDDTRVFPQDYAGRMIPLARAMLAYFDGDVDVVGHYCGLEIEEERERPGEDPRRGTRTWRREYFATDALSPQDWEAPFAASVARIDAILKERYDHRLPFGAVREFYDNVDTFAWQSKKRYPVEEVSVGLQGKYISWGGHHLPSIVIEARSVAGNRKACEAVCEMLSREAAALFGVCFDHVSLAVEEHRDLSRAPDQATPDSPEPGD
ncbi:MAG: hypothetical protein A2Z04_06890 [Chloroflexi bacterium RBG_16_57_9]|nr:MAG: hypothetical protein A2Z04_06890 [Chloroflexi bacterium RBG_16_57_9]